MFLSFLIGLGIVLAISTIGVLLDPEGIAVVLETIPVVGPLAVTECFRCTTPVLRTRAEEMPVIFGDSGPTDALTIKFCDECSQRMTFQDRLRLLRGETSKGATEIDADTDTDPVFE